MCLSALVFYLLFYVSEPHNPSSKMVVSHIESEKACVWPTLSSLCSRLFVTLLTVKLVYIRLVGRGGRYAYRFLLRALRSTSRETFREPLRHRYVPVMATVRRSMHGVSYHSVLELYTDSYRCANGNLCLLEKASSSHTGDHSLYK